MVFFLNGRFVSETEAHMALLEPGLLFGFGLFETVRAYRGRILAADAHWARLLNGADKLGLRLRQSKDELTGIGHDLLEHNKQKDAAIRISLYKGIDEDILEMHLRTDWFYPPNLYKEGVKVILGPHPINEKSRLTSLKTTNRIPNVLASQAAKRHNALEGLLLNTEGRIAEGSRSNIFWVERDTLMTPPLSDGCLDGVTRRKTIELARELGVSIREQSLTPDELAQANEAFLTSTLLMVMPIAESGTSRIATGRPGVITKSVLDAFKKRLDADLSGGA